MTHIVAVHGALPDHVVAQDDVTALFASMLEDEHERELLGRVHEHAGVRTRHTVLPIEDYARDADFGERNATYVEHGAELGRRAVLGALAEAGLEPTDVDTLILTSVTGVAAPSLDVHIANRAGLRSDVKRVPMFGLGCVGGAVGVSRLHDYLRGAPDDVAVLVSVELCSLTFQRDDRSPANLVASGLFGDGAAAVVGVGDRRRRSVGSTASGARVLDSGSNLYPDTQRVMGWDVGADGFRIVLDPCVPDLADQYLRGDVEAVLGRHGLTIDEVSTWVCHPGGPKVIEAIVAALKLPPEALDLTWRSLAEIGNLSSASVLHVLGDTLRTQPPLATPGVLMALGPGFCSEVVLLEWT